MSLTSILILGLIISVIGLIVGFIKRDNRMKIISGIGIISVVIIILFLTFVLIPAM